MAWHGRPAFFPLGVLHSLILHKGLIPSKTQFLLCTRELDPTKSRLSCWNWYTLNAQQSPQHPGSVTYGPAQLPVPSCPHASLPCRCCPSHTGLSLLSLLPIPSARKDRPPASPQPGPAPPSGLSLDVPSSETPVTTLSKPGVCPLAA